MKKVNITSSSFKSLEPAYIDDDDVVLFNKTFQSKEGIGLTINESLSSPQDSTISNYSALTLTNKFKPSDIGYVKTNKISNYPEKFTTYLAANIVDTGIGIRDTSLFVAVSAGALGEAHFDTTQCSLLSNSRSLSGNNENYFDVELLDENTCTISHFDNYKTLYLTYNNANDLLFFNTVTGANTSFKYLIDRESDYIVLYKPDASGGPKVIKYVETANGLNILKGVDPTAGSKIPETLTPLKIRYFTHQNKNIEIENNWISYDTANIDNNTLTVDQDKSYDNVTNNYLINSEYNAITGTKIPYNFTPLKNQLTGENSQGRNNPFKNEIPVDFRDYEKIFTGISQIEGTDKINLGYQSWTKNITFEPGKVTFFHLPQDIYPYQRITLEDSGLIESGAIAGDTPLRSDKIFKKKANYKDTSNFGDSEGEDRGTFLCSWLMFRPSISATIWVDRYYDDSKLSYFQAISAPSDITYTSEYDSVIDQATASTAVDLSKTAIFDITPSELTFEAGCLYAYHRIGDSDSDNIVSSIPGLVQQGLHTYTDASKNEITPTTKDNTLEYTFDRNNFGSTTVPENDERGSNFTLSFDMYSDDWSKPFGNQIAGNYNTEGGFGIFNKYAVTPFMIIPDVDNTYIFNTDFKLLGTIPVSGNKIGWSDALDKFYILQHDKVLSYDFKGNRIGEIIPDFPDNLRDIHITRDNPIGNIVLGDAKGRVNYYNYRTEAEFAKNWGNLYTTDVPLNFVSNVSTGDINYILSYRADVDIYGGAWFTDYFESNWIYKYPDIAEGTAFVAITSVNFLDFKTDLYGDLWILKDNSHLTKMSNNRRDIIFSSAISSIAPTLSSVSLSGHKHIDFIREFDDTGLQEYFILLDQNYTSTLSSNTTCYYFNMSGFYVKQNNVEANIVRSLSADNLNLNFSGDNTGLTSTLDSINNYNYYKQYYNSETKDNSLSFRHKLVNPVDVTDYDIIEFTIRVEDLKTGKNNFIYSADNTSSTYSLYINNNLHKQVDLTKTSTDGSGVRTVENKYRFDNTIHRSMLFGSAPYYDGISLQEGIQQPKHYLGENFKFSNISLINNNLNFFDSKYIFRSTQNILPLEWICPAGARNYIDTVDRFFKHRLPGYKTNNYNIYTSTSTITANNAIQAYEHNIKSNITEYTPINRHLNTSTWIY